MHDYSHTNVYCSHSLSLKYMQTDCNTYPVFVLVLAFACSHDVGFAWTGQTLHPALAVASGQSQNPWSSPQPHAVALFFPSFLPHIHQRLHIPHFATLEQEQGHYQCQWQLPFWVLNLYCFFHLQQLVGEKPLSSDLGDILEFLASVNWYL